MLKRLGHCREKMFGDGRPLPLDRNGKARLITLARALMRRTEKGRAYGAITAKAFAVLEALLWSFHNAKSGLCFPGYTRIAEAAGCAVSTVGEAIKMLEAAGLLTWVNRLARIKVYVEGLGWRKRVIRTSNAYAFADPGAGATVDTVGQGAWVRSRSRSKTETSPGTRNQEVSQTDAAGRRDLLPNESPLDEALARFRNAMQRRRESSE